MSTEYVISDTITNDSIIQNNIIMYWLRKMDNRYPNMRPNEKPIRSTLYDVSCLSGYNIPTRAIKDTKYIHVYISYLEV